MATKIPPLLAFALVVALCANARADCTKDTDCKGDRVCENGRCVNPYSSSSSDDDDTSDTRPHNYGSNPTMPALQYATMCITNFGTCQMMVAGVAQGAPCYCQTFRGPIWGVAR
ncbi:MAG TPA: hypothetical protein VFB32_05545 [Rudaea sp.]|nr:hypothetical protein [Rudaea sp.]